MKKLIVFILIFFAIFAYTVYAIGSWTVGSGGDIWVSNVSFDNTTKNIEGNVVLNYSNWWNSNWNYRIGITINTTDYNRTNYPIEYSINFTEELSNACSGTCVFDNNSVRVIEYNETRGLIQEVNSQFDEASNYNNQTNAIGEVVWLLNKTTLENTKRYYFIYFDTTDNPKTAPSYSPSFTTTYNAGSNITVTYNGNTVTVVDIKTGGTRSAPCVRSTAGLLQFNTLDGTSSISPTQDWIIPDEYLYGAGCSSNRVEPYELQEYTITSGPVKTQIFTKFKSNKLLYVYYYNFTWTFYSGEDTELKGKFNWTVLVNTTWNFGNSDWPRQLGIDQASSRYGNYSTGSTTGGIGACVWKVDAQDRYDSVFNDAGSYPTISFVTTKSDWSALDLNSCKGSQRYLFGHCINGTKMNYSGLMNNLWWFHLYPGVFNNTKTSRFSDSVMNPVNITKESTEIDKFHQLGNLTSIAKDAGSGHGWRKIKFEGNVPTGTNISLYFNSSSDNGVTDPYSGWVEVQLVATNGTYYTIPSANQERYGSWRLELQTNNTSISPELYNVTINYLSSDGSFCSLATECLGNYCVHGVCRSSSTHCGDAFCDEGEICSEDCGGEFPPTPPGLECPTCSEPSEWSECINNTQSRIAWYCGRSTYYRCKNMTESQSCEVFNISEIVGIITDANNTINQAREENKNVSEAETLFNLALDAFNIEDYPLAKTLAEQAKQVALGTEVIETPTEAAFDYITLLIVVINLITIIAAGLILSKRI